MKRRITLEVGVILDIDEEAVPDAVSRTQTEEWRSQLYDLTEDETYAMLAYWFGVHGQTVLDGWGDIPKGSITGHADYWEAIDVEVVPEQETSDG